MTQREKYLGLAVVGLLSVVALWLLVTTISGMFEARRKQIGDLRAEIERKERVIARGKAAAARRADYESRSLPPDTDLARSQYQTWLRASFEACSWQDIKLLATPARVERNIFVQHTCTVTARANLEQFTRWMHTFYSANHLHRIRRCTLAPIKDSKLLTITLTVEALSLPGSENVRELSNVASQRLKLPTVDDYVRDIVGRNVFAPANKPPSLTVSNRQQGNKGRALRFSARASDPDKLDRVRFALEGEIPEGAKIDPSSGEFSWTPKENGEYAVTIVAFDDGLPSKSAKQKVTIQVTDPPPPVPVSTARRLEFDDAKYTFLTAIIRNGDSAMAWFTIRTTGETLKLKPGGRLRVGSIEGTLAEIGDNDVTIETVDKKRLVVIRGDNLAQAQEVQTGP